MAEVPSTFRLEPGQPAPDFELPDAQGRTHRLEDIVVGKRGVVVAFVCNHCPFVIHLAERLGERAAEFAEKGVATVAISANDVANYPADSPEKMVEFARENGWDFPYLYDESQGIANAYSAACTPDFYLFDGDRKLFYAGQFDETRPGKGGDATGDDLAAAVDRMLAGEPSPEPWYPSTGCNIKWKPGAEPDYFT